MYSYSFHVFMKMKKAETFFFKLKKLFTSLCQNSLTRKLIFSKDGKLRIYYTYFYIL